MNFLRYPKSSERKNCARIFLHSNLLIALKFVINLHQLAYEGGSVESIFSQRSMLASSRCFLGSENPIIFHSCSCSLAQQQTTWRSSRRAEERKLQIRKSEIYSDILSQYAHSSKVKKKGFFLADSKWKELVSLRTFSAARLWLCLVLRLLTTIEWDFLWEKIKLVVKSGILEIHLAKLTQREIMRNSSNFDEKRGDFVCVCRWNWAAENDLEFSNQSPAMLFYTTNELEFTVTFLMGLRWNYDISIYQKFSTYISPTRIENFASSMTSFLIPELSISIKKEKYSFFLPIHGKICAFLFDRKSFRVGGRLGSQLKLSSRARQQSKLCRRERIHSKVPKKNVFDFIVRWFNQIRVLNVVEKVQKFLFFSRWLGWKLTRCQTWFSAPSSSFALNYACHPTLIHVMFPPFSESRQLLGPPQSSSWCRIPFSKNFLPFFRASEKIFPLKISERN